MTDREKLIAEVSAVIDSDIRTAIAGGPVTAGELKAIAIRSAMSLMAPPPALKVERDPRDPNRIIISGPGVEVLQRFGGRIEP